VDDDLFSSLRLQLAFEPPQARLRLPLSASRSRPVIWLNQERPFGRKSIVSDLTVGRSFDVLVYLDVVTPACNISAARGSCLGAARRCTYRLS
jgi:hypothetical protein